VTGLRAATPKPRATGLTLDKIVANNFGCLDHEGALRGVDDARSDRLPDAVVQPVYDSGTGG